MNLDLELLHWINGYWASPELDRFFSVFTNLHKFDVVRFGLFPAVLASILWFTQGRAWKAIVVLSLTVALSDNLSHRVIKPMIGRDRPFVAHPSEVVLRLDYQPGGLSFPSNHASNLAATSTLLAWYVPWTLWFAIPVTLLVAYSRAYLGVHYPSDLLAGLALGWMIARVLTVLIRRWLPSWGPKWIGRV